MARPPGMRGLRRGSGGLLDVGGGWASAEEEESAVVVFVNNADAVLVGVSRRVFCAVVVFSSGRRG